jgi:predicted O-methyltransferase YrrM
MLLRHKSNNSLYFVLNQWVLFTMVSFSAAYYSLKQYLKFLSRSKNQHGVHSPFVYDLVTQCFYDSAHHNDYDRLWEFRRELTQSKAIIEVTDLGSGSRVGQLNKTSKRVRNMLHHAGASKKRQRLLYRLGAYFKPEQILELGTHLGMGSTALCIGAKPKRLITVEGCPETAQYTQNNIMHWGSNNPELNSIELINNNFEDFLIEFPGIGYSHDVKREHSNPSTFDLIYLDGHHDGPATLRYFETLKNYIHDKTVLIIDDIHWSAGMSAAWLQIIKDPQVSVSIDIFYCGFLFFHPTQAKEDFVIRV